MPSSSPSSREAMGRDKRRSRLMGGGVGSTVVVSGNNVREYVPPSLDASDDQYSTNTTSTNDQPPANFVTAPPPVRERKITSGISMLFRRPSSREPGKRNRERGGGSNKGSPTKKSAAASNTAGTTSKIPLKNRVSPIAAAHPAVPMADAKAAPAAVPPASSAAMPPPPKTNSRLFYSSQLDDDDSQDSYESRLSQVSQGNRGGVLDSSNEHNTTGTSELYDDDDDDTDNNTDLDLKKMTRFRGFSTSIKHLFLDEQLVCASIGCFGLILSQRTEYLLNLRNERRGVSRRSSTKNSGKRAPSRIVAYGLLLTLFLIGVTFIVWGFGSGNTDQYALDYYDGVDYDVENEGDDVINYYKDDDDDRNYAYMDDDRNDDGYNNNNNNNYGDDDGGNNNNNNNYGDDDGWNNNNNNNNGGYNDDGNGYNDDGNRLLETETDPDQNYKKKHPVRGVFKVRDYQEGLWEPMCTLIAKEWNRNDENGSSSIDLDVNGERFLEDNDGYSNYYKDDDDGYSSNSYNEEAQPKQRDVGSTVRMCLIFAFFILLGVVGRRRRMRTRYALVRARAQEDHLYFASEGSAGAIRPPLDHTREDQYEGACSHTLCGCYPVDPPALDDDDVSTSSSVGTPTRNRRKRKYMDCVSRGFQCLLSACCGTICKCWCQCLSVCALAQEAREVRLLVPPRLQRIDFITHQPFHEYQKDVNDLRKGWMGKRRPKSGIMPHIYALSKLSRYIVLTFFLVTLAIVLTLIFNPLASFSWNDGVVLIATFVQSFLVLYVVHWIFHKSDLSLDAVIKFFAAGFIIATPSAFLFEGLLVNCFLMGVYSIYALLEWILGDFFVNWVIERYAILWIVGELFNAYVVAAVTEELCKYYTFRSIEHPDLIFLTGLDRKHHEASAVDGGIASYSFAGHQVSDFNQRVNSFKSESEYSHRSNSSRRSRRSARSNDMDPSERMIDRTNTTEEFYEDDHDVRTYRQQSAAVTTGMIGVAVGLACAENFLYVFLLGGTTGGGDNNSDKGGGNGVLEEWLVLFFRSIFPIHALAAAMQSINMIRKFVECSPDNSHNIGVGRIIFPAVILHGSFDAVLMGINVFVEYSWDQYLEQNDGNNDAGGEPYNPVALNLVAWTSIIVIMLSGMLWYYRENRKQRLRLIILEERDKAREADLDDPYTAKSRIPTRPTDIELV